MATTNKTTTAAAAFPAKTAKAPAVVAKAGKLLAAAADGVPGAGPKPTRTKSALAKHNEGKAAITPAAKAPAKPRSAAAKRAEPTGTKKVATKAAKPATAPAKPAKGEPSKHSTKNVAALIKFLSTMPSGGSFDVERKFGVPTIQVKNIRGRVIAEVAQLAK